MPEQEVQFQYEGLTLSGTVALPEGTERFPAIVLITGSGQVDRDENAAKLPINVFKQLAAFMAENGMATLRYDKLGVGASDGNFWETGFYDNAGAAARALDYLRQYPGVDPDKVFLLGHSEGALISTHLAAEGAPAAGIILLSGSAQKGEEILKWQAREIARTMKGFSGWLIRTLKIDVAKSQKKQIEKIKNSKKDSIRVQIFARINAKWMREFLEYDPLKDFEKIKMPVLAITGAKDIQVDPHDLEKLAAAANTDYEYHILPDVTHLLRKQEGLPSISTYKDQVKLPVDREVFSLVLDWLKRRV